MLAQHGDLTFVQRYRAVRLMRHADLGEQPRVRVEELGGVAEVIRDEMILHGVLRHVLLACAHSSILPSKTRSAGPVIQTGASSPAHVMLKRPPSRSTATS